MAWVRVSDDERYNGKIQRVSDSAKVLNGNARQHCNKQGTGGLIQRAILSDVTVGMSGKKVESYIRELVEVRKPGSDAGLWHSPGETCDHEACPAYESPVPKDSWVIHDYFQYLPSPEKAAATSSKRAEAGRIGGLASGKIRSKAEANSEAKSKQIASDVPKQTGSNGEAKTNPVSRIPIPVTPTKEGSFNQSPYPLESANGPISPDPEYNELSLGCQSALSRELRKAESERLWSWLVEYPRLSIPQMLVHVAKYRIWIEAKGGTVYDIAKVEARLRSADGKLSDDNAPRRNRPAIRMSSNGSLMGSADALRAKLNAGGPH